MIYAQLYALWKINRTGKRYFLILLSDKLIKLHYFCQQLDGDLNLAPQFPVPGNTDYKGYHNYIDEVLPQESPALYGLHLNAEIGFLTTLSDSLFRVVHDLQPRDAAGASQSGSTREEVS